MRFPRFARVPGGFSFRMSKDKRARHNSRRDLTQNRMNRSLDRLAEYELFDQQIMPQLKKMVLENWSPEKIRKAFAPVMQAQMIKKGLGGDFKAIKDILDRHEGTAIQRMEAKTIYAQMTKKELAALALQKLSDARIIDTTGKVVKEVDIEKDKK